MFRREQHHAIEPVLAALDADALDRFRVALRGATRIALAYGEIRISHDIDLLCSDGPSWAALRTAVAERGYAALFTDPSSIALPRPPTADQYGIRFVAGASVKVEIIREAPISLGPSVRTSFCALPCLSITDVYTEKLLANADRGDDPSQLDRDLLDLAVLRAKHGAMPSEAIAAAEVAYGRSAWSALDRCVRRLRADRERFERDVRGLRVDDEITVRRGLDALAGDLGQDA